MKRFIRRILKWLIILVIVATVIPFVVPIPTYSDFVFETPFPESRQQEVDGIMHHYRSWLPDGEIQGKILLLHGLAGSTFSFRHNTAALVDAGYAVLAVDLPGLGYSDRKPGSDYSQKERSRLMWKLLDMVDAGPFQAAAGEDWVLLGHSIGGATAVAMTLERPEYTRALALAAGTVFDYDVPPVTLLDYPPFRRIMEIYFYYEATSESRVETYLEKAYGRPPTPEELEGYHVPLRLPGTTRAMVDLDRTGENEPLGNLNAVDIPMRAFWGTHDPSIPLYMTDELRRIVPNFEVVLFGDAAHCPMETHPEEFNEALLAYLGELP